MTDYLTTAGAAQLLAVTPARVRQLARQGVLAPAARTESGIRLFRRQEVERLARRRAKQGREHGPKTP